jgi:hypothetical protein
MLSVKATEYGSTQTPVKLKLSSGRKNWYYTWGTLWENWPIKLIKLNKFDCSRDLFQIIHHELFLAIFRFIRLNERVRNNVDQLDVNFHVFGSIVIEGVEELSFPSPHAIS